MTYHFIGCYNITKRVHDRMFVRIPVEFDALRICHGMKVEQGPVFSYKYRALINDHQSIVWVVAYTERVVCTCALMLSAAYEQYKL